MLSKEEFKAKKISFWFDFKQYMSKIKSSNGKRISWLSYPTEVKNIHLRLITNKDFIALSFDIQYKDDTIRAVFWEQMLELKNVLNNEMGDDAIWEEHCSNEIISNFCRIQWKKENLNYLNEKHKDEIFIFFKEKLVAFDNFYQEFKEILLFLDK